MYQLYVEVRVIETEVFAGRCEPDRFPTKASFAHTSDQSIGRGDGWCAFGRKDVHPFLLPFTSVTLVAPEAPRICFSTCHGEAKRRAGSDAHANAARLRQPGLEAQDVCAGFCHIVADG